MWLGRDTGCISYPHGTVNTHHNHNTTTPLGNGNEASLLCICTTSLSRPHNYLFVTWHVKSQCHNTTAVQGLGYVVRPTACHASHMHVNLVYVQCNLCTCTCTDVTILHVHCTGYSTCRSLVYDKSPKCACGRAARRGHVQLLQ